MQHISGNFNFYKQTYIVIFRFCVLKLCSTIHINFGFSFPLLLFPYYDSGTYACLLIHLQSCKFENWQSRILSISMDTNGAQPHNRFRKNSVYTECY
jgi:hypothetical protein